jgi:hypothetical protein
MSYIYEVSQKEGIHNVYRETAKATLLFQNTDFSNELLSKNDIKPIISALLNTFKYTELYLNTVHLSYSLLHLIKLETDINKKALYHLICIYLFSRIDSVTYKNHIDIETRIFNSYFEQNKDAILERIPTDIFKAMTNSKMHFSEDEFKLRFIPFLTEQIEIK